jgi:AcrR family transcriptional regulator
MDKSRAAAKTDGRLNRSIVTRKKIVDALTALIYEGFLSPTADQVAARADVGLRTVFRHFDDMDSLYREISMNLDGLVMPLIHTRLAGPTWRDRLLQTIPLRAGIFDRVAAIHLAAQVHRHESAFLTRNLTESATMQRELLRGLLPDTVAQDALLFDALDVALSIEAWIRLRREQGLSAEAAQAVMHRTVAALITGY